MVHLDRSVVVVLLLHVMGPATAVLDELLLLPAVVEDLEDNVGPGKRDDETKDEEYDDPSLDDLHAV